MPNVGSERGRLRGVKLALAWLDDQPGQTWQRRWLASGADARAKDDDGKDALALAKESGNAAVVALLEARLK